MYPYQTKYPHSVHILFIKFICFFILSLALISCEEKSFETELKEALEEEDFVTVAALWKGQADSGNVTAMVEIGRLYEEATLKLLNTIKLLQTLEIPKQ